jgi:hypothetical protein
VLETHWPECKNAPKYGVADALRQKQEEGSSAGRPRTAVNLAHHAVPFPAKWDGERPAMRL